MKLLGAAVVASCLASAPAFAQSPLLCPPSASATAVAGCEAFHYHMQMYRPDPRGFVDATATPRFASQSACEAARESHVARNLTIVQYFKKTKNEQQYEPDRVGPCHCDHTREKTNPAFLNDAQRLAQIRAVEDARLRVREKLLDSGLTSADEMVRSLIVPPMSLPVLSRPKLVSLPQSGAPVATANSADDLRSTRALESTKPAVATLDLPLAEVSFSATFEAAPAGENADAVMVAAGDENLSDETDVAGAFIEHETARIQDVLSSATTVTDEMLKSRIFEATLQRTQVLSNLRTLIEGSGVKSRLAAAARAAESEEERLALVSSLFGKSVAPHWAPKQPSDVILPVDRDIDSEPERVLRDSGGRYNDQQKRRALYALLSRSQPSAEQQLWLITVVDSFLR